MIQANIMTEIAPIVGSEEQAMDLIQLTPLIQKEIDIRYLLLIQSYY